MTLGISKEYMMSASSIPKDQTPERDSVVEGFIKEDEKFSLSNIEHKMILSALDEEITKPFTLKNKYYQDEETTMVKGYLAKT